MSIFFDFDVGPSGRRFRRSVDGDKYDIELFWKPERTEKLFGDVNIGSLIELNTLSICMINEKKEVVGFMSMCDHPNVPGVDPADWENWIRNMFQKYFLSRNTLFIHFFCCENDVEKFFLEEALISVFLNDMYLLQIVLLVPPGYPSEWLPQMTKLSIKRRSLHKCCSKREKDDDCGSPLVMYVAIRQEFCPKLKIRRAVEEDNDDIVEILDQKCPRLKELYGNYYVSEIIGRHPESLRKILVADFHARAVGVMCLSTDINYDMLQKKYQLQPYYGLKKAIPLDKEKRKRANSLLRTFGQPIMLGKINPFDPIAELRPKMESEENLKQYENRSSSKGKVYFGRGSTAIRRSFEHLYYQHHSDDYSEKMTSPNPSIATNFSTTVALLEGDPFDYDIVNIDPDLLAIPEALSFSVGKYSSKGDSISYLPKMSRIIENKIFRRPRNSIYGNLVSSDTNNYCGEGNAFIIELFALREDFDERQSFDFLEAAFEIMKDLDYCVIRVPCAEKPLHLLQHFCYVPSQPYHCSKYALYVLHRSSLLNKLRVRKAEFIDIPQIAQLLQNLEGKDTIWTVENGILHRRQLTAYVFISGMSLIGFGILEPPEQTDFLRAKFNLSPFHIHKYHIKGHDLGAGFTTLKAALVYPVFETHFRFFAREMLRLSGSGCLMWLTAYRNKWVVHKANSIVSSMIPLLPRKSEIDCAQIFELKRINKLSKNIMAFSTWFLNKKLTSVPKLNIDTRIVIVGASRTAMAFLDILLFSDSCTYLTFTNVSLMSPHGLPYVRQSKPINETMFPKYRTNSDKYLKSVPYTYYVNVVHETMMEINRQEKYITLTNGLRYYYDVLFLLFGKQYQHPEYLKPLLDRERQYKCSDAKPYVRLDLPRPPTANFDIVQYDIPDNVFIINNTSDSNRALGYIRNFSWQDAEYKILVYGATINAYCCISALLEMKVPTQSIVFIEPFPFEDSSKIRVPVFCNMYVDQTVREFMNNLNITVYSSYYFHSWMLDLDNTVTHVNFLSHFQMLRLECSAFFYYGTRGVDMHAFVAVNKSGIVYDGGILIDHQFRTKDPYIYAAGPATRYFRRYYAEKKRQKYYDSYEVGEKLGEIIRNKLDPLRTERVNEKDRLRVTSKSVSFDATSNNHKSSFTSSSEKSINSHILRESCEGAHTFKLPDLKKPLVMHCTLPGGLQYLDVRPPGKKFPHHYVQSLEFNGFVMETFKRGYFKLHLNKDLIVTGVTCLTLEKFPLENFRSLYGLSAAVLNNVHLRYTAKKLDCFYDFFRAPWAYFLYHEQSNELFAMVQELIPKGAKELGTVREALKSASDRLINPTLKSYNKLRIRSSFEKSAHVEAITSYVIEWLSETDVLLPMYLQPWQVPDFTYDVSTNPIFKKKKTTVRRMLAQMN